MRKLKPVNAVFAKGDPEALAKPPLPEAPPAPAAEKPSARPKTARQSPQKPEAKATPATGDLFASESLQPATELATARVNVTLPRHVHRRLKMLAAAERIKTIDGFMCEAIVKTLENTFPEAPAGKGA